MLSPVVKIIVSVDDQTCVLLDPSLSEMSRVSVRDIVSEEGTVFQRAVLLAGGSLIIQTESDSRSRVLMLESKTGRVRDEWMFPQKVIDLVWCFS